jgi:hypothetical protein
MLALTCPPAPAANIRYPGLAREIGRIMTDRQSEFDEIEIDEGEKIIPAIAADGDSGDNDKAEGNAAAEAVSHSFGSTETD